MVGPRGQGTVEGGDPVKPDKHGNVLAQEGCDRCACGSKYWEFDLCIDCLTPVTDPSVQRSEEERL